MGLPVRQLEPRLSVVSELGPRPLNGRFRAVEPADKQFDLTTIIETVFDPAEDLLIYETLAEPQTALSNRPRLCVPRGAALPAVALCSATHALLGGKSHVVALVHPSSWTQACTQQLKAIPANNSRCILLTSAPNDRSISLSELKDWGWHVEDRRDRSTARGLAKTLVGARHDNRATVMLIDDCLMPEFGAPPDLGTTSADQRPADDHSGTLAVLAAEWKRRCSRDPRLVPIVLVDDPLWQSLSDSSIPPESPSPITRFECGLWQAVALTHSGCHPLVVADHEEYRQAPQLIAAVLTAMRSQCTLIALDAPGAKLRNGIPSWPREVVQRRLPARLSVRDAQEIVSECLDANRTVVLQVPGREITADEPLATVRSIDEHSLAPPPGERNGEAPPEVATVPATVKHTPRPHALQQYTDDDVQNVARYIREFRFNPLRRKWIDRYRSVGKRDVYLWRWTSCAVEWLTLSCVAPEWRSDVCDTKFLAAMLNVLLDDVVDEQHDPSALTDILNLMAGDVAPVENHLGRYGELILDIWSEINSRTRRYPRESEFQRLLAYDFRQLCNQVDYSGLLLNQPHLINQTEHDLYSPHGMMVAYTATIDLTCSPGFQSQELGTLREAVWHANSMARIGNLVTTWQREIVQNDFSSGVFARAVSLGWLVPDDLAPSNESAIVDAIRQSGVEQEFSRRWEQHRDELISLADRISSVSIHSLVQGLERLLISEFASRGHK